MTRAEFQSAYGEQWASITSNPAFFTAMQLANAAFRQRISGLSDEEIKEHSQAILGGARERQLMEDFLIELAVAMPSANMFDLPPETYGSVSAEAQTEHSPAPIQTIPRPKKPKKKPK